MSKQKLEKIIDGLIIEIYKAEEALALYNKISDNAVDINAKNFGSFFSSIQRNLLDSIFLSLSKIYEYNESNEVKSIPSIRKLLHHNHAIEVIEYPNLARDLKHFFNYTLLAEKTDITINQELSDFIKGTNPYNGRISSAIKDSRDKLIVHLDTNVNQDNLDKITWNDVNKLIKYSKELVSTISNAYLSICYIDDNGRCAQTSEAQRASACLTRLLTKINVID